MRLGTLRNTQQINTQSVNKQQGFTLIELVVVIVILGILAVTAAPKFIDITSDAKGAVLDATKASMNSAADLVHAKALVAGETKSTGAVSAAGKTINLKFGWPVEASIADLIDVEELTEVSGSAGTFEHDAAVSGSTCRVVYDDNSATSLIRPAVTVTRGGC